MWGKKRKPILDITMGAYDGAEMCEFVGLYILHKMKTNYPEIHFGLYRDDGLGTYIKTDKQELEQKRKAISKMFKEMDLNITSRHLV